MDISTCRTILRGKTAKYSEAITFRTFKIVVENVLYYQMKNEGKENDWLQILINFDVRNISWDFNRFHSLLLLSSSISLLSENSNTSYNRSLINFMKHPYIAELFDLYCSDLVSVRTWTPLYWTSVHVISRVVSISELSINNIIKFSLSYLDLIPQLYDSPYIKHCSNFYHSVSSAVFLFIELYEV